MHGSHALIESMAALVLTVGGAAIVARAWLDRVRGAVVRIEPTAAGDPAGVARRSADALGALLSTAAAVIHLAAAPVHVEALGDVGLGFYWAALLQGGFALAWLLSGRSARLVVIGLGVNAALICVWLWSRTVGIGGPGGPEPIGLADGAAVLIEAVLIAVLASTLGTRRPPARLTARVPAAAAAVAIGGVAVLATAIALVDIGGGHDHAVSGSSGPAHSTDTARTVTR
jgi:hypothetical protein